jgi:hypothetical protein
VSAGRDAGRRCEAQTGVRWVLWLNAVRLPRARWCPHPAVQGSRWCAQHADREVVS